MRSNFLNPLWSMEKSYEFIGHFLKKRSMPFSRELSSYSSANPVFEISLAASSLCVTNKRRRGVTSYLPAVSDNDAKKEGSQSLETLAIIGADGAVQR